MSVLGALLLDPGTVGEVAEVLKPDDFYRQAHSAIYEAILHLDARNREADLVTLTEELTRREQLEEVGGKSFLIELMEVLPSAANAVHYAEIIREKAMRRRLASAADRIRQEAFRSPEAASTVLDRAEAAVFEIGKEEAGRGTIPVGKLLVETFNMIERFQESPGTLEGLDTGFLRLNDLTGGLKGGELVVVAARPSMGKTTFALNLAINASLRQGSRTLFFSLEMSEEQITQSLLCASARVDAVQIRQGRLSDQAWADLLRAADVLHEAPFLIDATPGLTPMAIRTKARRVAMQKGGLGLVVVDYLQLMSLTTQVESRQQEISQISRSLKDLARELRCPVVALSQLNRSVDSREDHRPRLSDLRESGAIEQDADLIMFLYRDDYYHPPETPPGPREGSPTEVLVAKHRNGPTGKAELLFFPHFLRFENPASQDVE